MKGRQKAIDTLTGVVSSVTSQGSELNLSQISINHHWHQEYAELDLSIVKMCQNLPAEVNELLLHDQIEQQLPRSCDSVSRESLLESQMVREKSTKVKLHQMRLATFNAVLNEFKQASFFSLPNLLACMTHVANSTVQRCESNLFIKVDDFSNEQLEQLADVCHLINRKDLAVSLRAAIVYAALMKMAFLSQHNYLFCRTMCVAILAKGLNIDVVPPIVLYFTGVGNRAHAQSIEGNNLRVDRFLTMFLTGMNWSLKRLGYFERELTAIANEAFDLSELDISIAWNKIFSVLVRRPIFTYRQFAAELPLCERSILRLLVTLTRVGLVQRHDNGLTQNLSIWQVTVVLNCLKEFDRQCLIPELVRLADGYSHKDEDTVNLRHGGIYHSNTQVKQSALLINPANTVAANYLQSNCGLVRAS